MQEKIPPFIQLCAMNAKETWRARGMIQVYDAIVSEQIKPRNNSRLLCQVVEDARRKSVK
jgi:hypothetical protein